MLIIIPVLILLLGTSAPGQETGATSASPSAVQPGDVRTDGFRRGVNLSHWYAQSWEGYDEPRLSTYMQQEDFNRIARMGFDHVRLTLDDTVLFDPDNPGQLKQEPLRRFESRVQQLLDAGLNVIVDLHPGDEFKQQLHEPQAQEALAKNWQALAGRLSRFDPARVWLEILNEPQDHWPSEQWRPVQGRILQAMRQAAPRHTIVVSGGGWGGADSLIGFEPYDDPNLVYTFHWYEPFLLTHQAAEWTWEPARHIEGLSWPIEPRAAEEVTAQVTDNPEAAGHVKQRIEAGRYQPKWSLDQLDHVKSWQNEHGVPVYVGEFGVYRKAAPPEGRYRWHNFVREAFEERGWGWAVWDYAGGFAVVNEAESERVPDEELRKALGLGNSATQPADQSVD